MTELNHSQWLNRDFGEAKDFVVRILIFVKLLYYFFQRPLVHLILREKLKSKLNGDIVFGKIDRFLLDEGGMFKTFVYKICDKFHSLKNSVILVPGVGYGRNLFQLAAFHPKQIVAFDLYEYKNEWDFLSQKIFKEFGTEVLFLKGDFENVPKIYEKQVDFIISDAVLEHIRDLVKFIETARKFLKRKGIFYASFGPIWYGPGGDHLDWGKDRLFDHLILNEKEYQKNFNETFDNSFINDSCEGSFLVKKNLFSRLRAEKYLNILDKAGFKKLLLWTKISSPAINLFKNNQDLYQILDAKGVPKFDRFCSGLYLYSRLK